jgi:hypothetical protein
MKANISEVNAKKSIFMGVIRTLVLLGLLTSSIVLPPRASAHELTIFTTSTISNGQIDPAPIIEGVGFASDSDKFDFTVDMGTTGVWYDSVAYIDDTHMRFNFHGTASKGTIQILAEASAFAPNAGHPSNQIEIFVAAPLILQTISFANILPISVGDKDQVLVVSSTSLLPVEVISNTPSVCTIDFVKVHAVAAGTCSVKAIQPGNSLYAPAQDVTKNVLILDNSALKKAGTEPIVAKTNLGSAIYDPTSVESGYISVLVSSSDQSVDNSTFIKLVIPKNATSSKTLILISAYSSDAQTGAGYFVARVAAVDASGASVREFEKNFELNIPSPTNGALPYYSFDGSSWIPLTKLSTEELPPEIHSAYFIESDGRIAILSRHFMLFGFRATQKTLAPIAPVEKLNVSSTATLKNFGGSGDGELTYATSTDEICSITESGVVTGLSVGTCSVTASKKASGIYADTHSKPVTIKIVSNSSVNQTQFSQTAPVNTGFFTHSLTFMIVNRLQTLDVGLCSIYANERAELMVGTKGKNGSWAWKKISSVQLDENGAGVFTITTKFFSGQRVRVLVNGVIQMESDV